MKRKSVFKFLLIAGVALEPMLEGVGLFGRWEGAISTVVANWKHRETSRVVIIGIDRHDYTQMFDSTLPLPVGRLAQVISAVKESGAVRVGVDLDTSDKSYARFAALDGGSRLVWGQPAQYSHVARKFCLYASPVGGADALISAGLTLASEDQDGVVRRYRRSYEIQSDDASDGVVAKQFLQSMPAKVAGTPDFGDTDEILIDFRGRERLQYSATSLLSNNGSEIRKQLRDKIVLIGNVFDSRDEHRTPLGWQYGVQILADAVDTELKIQAGSPCRSPSRWFTVGCMMVIALFTWLLFRPHASLWAYAGYFVGLTLLVLIASWTAYGSLINSLYFVPAVVAVSSTPVLGIVKKRWSNVKTHWKRRTHSLPVRDHASEANRVGSSGVHRATK